MVSRGEAVVLPGTLCVNALVASTTELISVPLFTIMELKLQVDPVPEMNVLPAPVKVIVAEGVDVDVSVVVPISNVPFTIRSPFRMSFFAALPVPVPALKTELTAIVRVPLTVSVAVVVPPI